MARDLTRNPIIIAVIWACSGIHGISCQGRSTRRWRFWLSAGVPCSLFALGLTLVRFRITGEAGTL